MLSTLIIEFKSHTRNPACMSNDFRNTNFVFDRRLKLVLKKKTLRRQALRGSEKLTLVGLDIPHSHRQQPEQCCRPQRIHRRMVLVGIYRRISNIPATKTVQCTLIQESYSIQVKGTVNLYTSLKYSQRNSDTYTQLSLYLYYNKKLMFGRA